MFDYFKEKAQIAMFKAFDFLLISMTGGVGMFALSECAC